MKQLVILSGKGGTGKTSLAEAFAHLSHDGPSALKAMLADPDVDAANLELVLRPERIEAQDFTGSSVAVIDPQLYQGYGECEQVCCFDAVLPPSSGDLRSIYAIDLIACDSCAACVYQCPEEAIYMQLRAAGQRYRSESRYRPLFHADLYPEGSAQIEAVCGELGVELTGQIPFDPTITEAVWNGEPVIAYWDKAPSSQVLTAIWQIVSARLVPSGGPNA